MNRSSLSLKSLLIALIPLCLSCSVFGKSTPLPEENVSFLAVDRMAVAPEIDGRIGEEEWGDTSAISGVTEHSSNRLIPRPVTFWLGWDPDHLYLACRVYLPAGYKPSVPAGRSEGLAYIWDDGLEVGFAPHGKNVPSGTTENSYKWFMNALGFGGDYSRIAVGQQFKNWAPNFQIATRVTDPGTAPDGGSWWELEFSSTPEDFELSGPHRAGDEWNMLLGVNHFPRFLQARVPANGAYMDSSAHTGVVLVEGKASVQLLNDTLDNLATTGNSNWLLRSHNPTEKDITLDISYEVAGQIAEKTLEVPAGESANVSLDLKTPEELEEGLAAVRVSQGNQLLLNYGAYFKQGYAARTLKTPAPPTQAFPFRAEFNALRSNFLIQGDTYSLEDPAMAKELNYQIFKEGVDKPIAEGSITQVAEYYLRDIVQLPPLDSGEYTVTASLILEDGNRLGPETATFVKKDESKEFEEWWNNDIGNPDRVIPPFTAMTQDGNEITCWGREYTLDALGLPKHLDSDGKNVMGKPAQVVAVVNGEEVRLPLDKSPTITSVKDWRVEFTGKASGGGIVVTSKGWIEQDGVTYVELTYEPEGKEPVEVESLRLEFPLNGEDSESLLCVGPGENFSARTAMILPTDEEGSLWSTLVTGRTGSQMTIGSFYPEVWIGNDRRGFLWWGDNDKGWVPNDDVPAHEAVRRGSDVVLINHIIGTPDGEEPYLLEAPKTLAFGYVATPFRPFPKGWRNSMAAENGTFWSPHRGTRKDSKTGEMVFPKGKRPMHVNWIHPETRYPEEWDEIWAEQKEKADRKVENVQPIDPYRSRSGSGFVHLSFQLIGSGHKSSDNETYKYFGVDWMVGGKETYSREMQDYFLWMFDQAFEKGGLRTVYFDLAFPFLTKDLQSGLAYELPDGRIQPGYNGFNIRRFMMRLSSLMNDHDLMPGGLSIHSTNAYFLIAMPWVDAVLDGEYHFLNDAATMDQVDGYPVDRMRAFSSPHNWGVPISWMQLIKFSDRDRKQQNLRSFAEYVWMHDSWLNPYIPKYSEMPESILDWGLNEDAVVYHPYWRNPLVTTESEDVLISTWQLPDRLIIGVFNNNRDKQVNVTLDVDLDAANLSRELPWQQFFRIRDLWKSEEDPGARLDLQDEQIQIQKLKPHTGRFFGIRLY
ncbi:glycoside hydrolase domain-containing protein [Puniceicoccus vermicola]|uniref:Glycoside hydrolase 123-like N-terminal domain-containing protein n=1 Tax=Puniceicoccus vermicola TaxID=388746 RepID=A0A7X1AZN2_9BACT|nr:glycoside hydrolase domain-containing protein [Puniceicoccus vermicola]MBC2602926.1 hypothetical protein [Puniceicoccus vermicola]